MRDPFNTLDLSALELASSLCRASVFTLLGQNCQNPSLLLCILICTNPSSVMHVFGVRVCDEMSVSICLCKRSGLLRDRAP